ncbi:MAG: calcium-translocating P-type ATPase, PMCA-type [Planctomyces sp.]|nr:calcium-translocating P-type ATPase, PMCA-type [Planctomyces sp.]
MSPSGIDSSETNRQGLTADEVLKSRSLHGANVITPPARDPWWKLFLEKFDDPVIRILLIAAVIAIAAGSVHGEYLEGIGIITAVLLATVLAFANEFKANKEFDVLNQVSDDVPIRVIRDGKFTSIPRKDIVVGDLVLIEAGEEVPADGNLFEAVGLQINESGLTGESEPADKVARNSPKKATMRKTTYPCDFVLRGAMVLDGHGLFEASAVGDGSEIGKTARAASEDTGEETPLNRQLAALSKVIGVVGLFMAVATFVALIVRGVVLGDLTLTSSQWGVFGIVAVGLAVALCKVWLPMVYDGLELAFGIEAPAWLGGDDDDEGEADAAAKTDGGSESGGSSELRQWLMLIGGGALLMAVGLGGGVASGWIPSAPGNWLPEGALGKFLSYFMIAVTIIVVAVPEGLAMSVTLSLAYSMRKMTAANTLVRKMHACETIGAATVICSDKTGTLTMNEMRVFEAVFPSLPDGKPSAASDAARTIVESVSTNTTAHLSHNEKGDLQVLGNPTEGALLFWLAKDGIDYVKERDSFNVTYQLTFSTERKWMGTMGVSSRSGRPVFHVKGAPEIVLQRCSKVRTTSGDKAIDGELNAIRARMVDFQARGMRTLGIAVHEDLPYAEGMNIETAATNLTWLGFFAIADPIRSDVPAAMESCRRAGIQVKMVTGDNADTAQEIGRQIGLYNPSGGTQQHLAGAAFQDLSDEAVGPAASALSVLSRAKPMDKVRLVRSLQKQGEVVAVTGDGINDCGALNYADVGLAMGKTGKAAAKEASDIILLDDSFATIVKAVMWGRSLYENIQRFILFQLTINVAALVIALLGPFIGVELPLTVIQMLWVNLIMDTFAALALATEPPHEGVLNRPPRHPQAFIVTKPMATGIFSTAAVFVVVLIGLLLAWSDELNLGKDEAPNRYHSIFFSVFVLLQFWNMFNARCLGMTRSALSGFWHNRGFVMIAAAIFIGQVLIVQFGGSLFRTVPLDLKDWLIITASTSTVLWVGEVIRFLKRSSGTP